MSASCLLRWTSWSTRLVDQFGYSCVVMIGDGATDMQVRLRATRLNTEYSRCIVMAWNSAVARLAVIFVVFVVVEVDVARVA